MIESPFALFTNVIVASAVLFASSHGSAGDASHQGYDTETRSTSVRARLQNETASECCHEREHINFRTTIAIAPGLCAPVRYCRASR